MFWFVPTTRGSAAPTLNRYLACADMQRGLILPPILRSDLAMKVFEVDTCRRHCRLDGMLDQAGGGGSSAGTCTVESFDLRLVKKSTRGHTLPYLKCDRWDTERGAPSPSPVQGSECSTLSMSPLDMASCWMHAGCMLTRV